MLSVLWDSFIGKRDLYVDPNVGEPVNVLHAPNRQCCFSKCKLLFGFVD